MTVKLVAELTVGVMVVDPNVTVVEPSVANPVPVIVTVVPPAVVPLAGARPVTVGAAASYVKFLELLAPLVVVTLT